DDNFSCLTTSLKVYESAPGDQMNLVVNLTTGGDLGNPVVADFDHDGRREVAVAEAGAGRILMFESTGDNALQLTSQTNHGMFNAYEVALIDRGSPDARPILFVAGQMGS